MAEIHSVHAKPTVKHHFPHIHHFPKNQRPFKQTRKLSFPLQEIHKLKTLGIKIKNNGIDDGTNKSQDKKEELSSFYGYFSCNLIGKEEVLVFCEFFFCIFD